MVYASSKNGVSEEEIKARRQDSSITDGNKK